MLCIIGEPNKTAGTASFCVFTTLVRGGIPKDLHFNVRIITNKGRQQCNANCSFTETSRQVRAELASISIFIKKECWILSIYKSVFTIAPSRNKTLTPGDAPTSGNQTSCFPDRDTTLFMHATVMRSAFICYMRDFYYPSKAYAIIVLLTGTHKAKILLLSTRNSRWLLSKGFRLVHK